MKYFWKVTVIESERGWGQRIEAIRYFKTQGKAQKYADSINKQNTATEVPDTYWRADITGPVEYPENKDFS